MARRVDGPEITGQVVHKQTGQSYGGVTVTVSPKVYTDPEMTASVTSLTADGTGVFSCYAPPGVYTFTTTAVDAQTLEPVEVLGREGGTGVSSAASLPSQTGNNGKFLTTDGSAASWASVISGADTVTTIATGGASQTLTLPAGQLGTWDLKLTAATCTLTYAGATAGTAARLRLIVRQDATGGRLIAWPGSVVWRNAVVPTLSTAANAVDLFEFLSDDGGTTWYGIRVDAAGIPTSILTAKGDVIAATGAAAATNLAVGTDGQVLTADSTQAPGVKWATPSSNPTAPLTLTGASDVVQLKVKENATQTSDSFEIQSSPGTTTYQRAKNGSWGSVNVYCENLRINATGQGAAISGQVFDITASTGTNGFLGFTESGVANRVLFCKGGDVVLQDSGSALATSATRGFTWLPNCAGTPTGTPAQSFTGATPCLIDTTNSKFWAYIGGTWKGVVLA